MIFVNKAQFFIIFMSCVLSSPIIASLQSHPHMQSPLLALQGSRKRALSVNESPARNINNTLMHEEFTSPVVVKFKAEINRIQDTPGDSKKTIIRSAVDSIFCKITDSQATDFQQNSQCINALRSPDKLIQHTVLMLAAAAECLSQDDRDKIAIIDTQHAATPTVKSDKHSKKKFVSGGHCLESYDINMIASHCFIAQDGCILGINIGRDQSKTVLSQFDEEAIFKNWNTRVKIAEDGSREFLRTDENLFLIAFRKDKKSIKIDTLYPILMVKTSEVTLDSSIKFGSFGMFSSDYKSMTHVDPVVIPIDECKKFMRHGKKIASQPGCSELFDVTVSVETSLKQELSSRGFYKSKLPGRMYILDDAQIFTHN